MCWAYIHKCTYIYIPAPWVAYQRPAKKKLSSQRSSYVDTGVSRHQRGHTQGSLDTPHSAIVLTEDPNCDPIIKLLMGFMLYCCKRWRKFLERLV